MTDLLDRLIDVYQQLELQDENGELSAEASAILQAAIDELETFIDEPTTLPEKERVTVRLIKETGPVGPNLQFIKTADDRVTIAEDLP